jgi:hypothetical protein
MGLPSLLMLFLLCALAIWCAYFTSGIWGRRRSGYAPSTDEVTNEEPRVLRAYGDGGNSGKMPRDPHATLGKPETIAVDLSRTGPFWNRPQFGPLTPDYTEFGALVVPPE